MPKRFSIILLGDPGAGKATQARYFAKKYNMYDFDMGKELAILEKKSTSARKILHNNFDTGLLTPTRLVRQIIQDKFSNLPKSKNLLFDGFPKMLGEAKMVAKLLNQTGRNNVLYIYLSIPQSEVIRRVMKRKGYKIGNKYSKRKHDSIVGLKNRSKYYRINIKQVSNFFKKHYPYARVDGMGTIMEVRKRIQKEISKTLKEV